MAELARTTVWASPTLEVVADGLRTIVVQHSCDRWGRPLLHLDAATPLVELVTRAPGPVPMLVRAASLRPIEVPDRVRARVELRGHLEPLSSRQGTVRLRGEVLTVDLDGTAVDPDAYAAAAVDPHVTREPGLLRKLLREHPASLARCCARCEPELLATAAELAPCGLDRHGLTVWLSAPGWTREIRLPFPRPVDDPTDLSAALSTLLDTASAAPHHR